MRVDVSKSSHREDVNAKQEFNKAELRRLRLLLRRLRFLEATIAQTGGLVDGGASGGAAFAEWEAEALEWVLGEIGFLAEPDRKTGTGA